MFVDIPQARHAPPNKKESNSSAKRVSELSHRIRARPLSDADDGAELLGPTRSHPVSFRSPIYPRRVPQRKQILPDLILDTPAAPSLLTKFTQQAMSDGCLPADYKPPTTPSPSPAAENGKQGA